VCVCVCGGGGGGNKGKKKKRGGPPPISIVWILKKFPPPTFGVLKAPKTNIRKEGKTPA